MNTRNEMPQQQRSQNLQSMATTTPSTSLVSRQGLGPTFQPNVLDNPWHDDASLSSQASAQFFTAFNITTRNKYIKIAQDFKTYTHDLPFGIADIMNFLAPRKDFDKAKSAITTIINANTGINLAYNFHLQRQCLGIRQMYPKRPRYDSIWNLPLLIDLFQHDFMIDKPDI